MDDGRLSLEIVHANGTSTRLGPDESDPGNIPQDLTFSTAAPGGFKDMQWSLLRDLLPRGDENLYDTVRVRGAGGRILWEGRTAQFPRQTGDTFSVQVGAIGHSAHLEDNPTFRDIFMDRSLDNWTDAPVEWRAGLVQSGISVGDLQHSAGNGGFSVDLPVQTYPPFTVTELWYFPPPGILIRNLYFIGTATNVPAGWTRGFAVASSRVPTGTVNALVRGAYSGDVEEYDLGGVPYALHRVYSNGTAATTSNAAQINVTAIGVSSNSVPLQAIFHEPPGVYASDVIARALSTHAPLLRYTTGSVGTIQPTTFPIPHLAFADPTTVADVIQRANVYHNWDWFVWEDRTFYFQPAGTGVEWQARRAEGSSLSVEGDAGATLYDRVFVSYELAGTGRRRMAGWPGSGFDVEDANLQDTDPNNPVVRNLRSPRPLRIDLSFPTSDSGAVELGKVALLEASLAGRAGSITLRGTVRHPTRGLVPVAEVRAGDTIRFVDIPDDVPRRIVETSYAHASRTNTLSINSTVAKLSALLERLIVQTGLIPNG